jgi:hypothetical protein
MDNILRKVKRKALSYILILALLITMAPAWPLAAGAASAADPPVPPDLEIFKNMHIFSANSKGPMSYCFYHDMKTVYYAPFVVEKEEAIISFTIYASQTGSLKLFEYNGPGLGQKYKDGNPSTFNPGADLGNEIGVIVGVQVTDNVQPGPGGKMADKILTQDEYMAAVINARQQAAAPIVGKHFYGMNDMPLSEYLAYPGAPPDPDQPYIRNWVYWRGHIDMGGGAASMVPDGEYVIVLEPESGYKSYLPVAIDSTGNAAEPLSGLEYEELPKFEIADPVNMLDGSFTWEYTDLTAEGAKPLSFARTYKSTNAGED